MNKLVSGIMQRIKTLLIARFEAETNPRSCDLYVRSLDRFYRKINACSKLFPTLEFDADSVAIVLDAAHHQIQLCRKSITDAIKISLAEVIIFLKMKKRVENLEIRMLKSFSQCFLKFINIIKRLTKYD